MLKQLILSVTLLLIFSTLCQGQGRLEKSKTRSHYTYIYQLTGKEAQKVYKYGPEKVSTSFYHTLVDSFEVRSGYRNILPQGHYLFLHSGGSTLNYKLNTYAPFTTKLLQLKPALAVLVHDSAGNFIENADVRVNMRRAAFDPVTKTYRLTKTPKKGLLTVKLDGFTYFEKLGKEKAVYNDYSILRKIINTAPIRYVWQPFNAIYRSIRWHHPQGWVRSVFSVFDSQYRLSEVKQYYTGYLVTNKPKYQPGDTVMYKAFIVEQNGKPVNGEASLQLIRYGMKPKQLGDVKPYRNGAFEGYFILQDSLKLDLDRQYTLALYKPGKKKKQYINGVFSYEDYELKENEYKLALKYDEHQTGRTNSIILRGTSANGLNLLDAKVAIAIKTRKVVQSEQPVVFIPDTLWLHEQPLDAVGETIISIPDSIFPKASLDYTVTATFLNANNERTLKSENASYSYTEGRLKFSLLQDSVLVQYLEGDSVKPREAVVSAYDPEYDDLFNQKVTLPVRLPVSAYAEGYEVTSGKLHDYLDLTEKPGLVELQTSRANDSLYFAIQNSRRLPFWYFVYRGEKLVGRGQGNETDFFFQQRAKNEKPYFVVVQYLWAGEMHKLQQDAPLQKHMLTINLKGPQVVYPGQQTAMKVAVTDVAGKPVADVDLTAYAITSNFKGQSVPNLPSWDKYKKQKPIRNLSKDEEGVHGSKLMDWDYWGQRMGLDSIAYYNFLFPATGIFTEYAPNADSITQVSPFVVDSGRIVPVHIIYLDEVPVYFSQTDVLPAYSFPADSGFHTIKLRTSEKLITLDSVYLKQSNKLVISADVSASEEHFASVAKDRTLSSQEQRSLYHYLFYVQHNPRTETAYLKQDNRVLLLEENRAGANVYNYYNRREGQLLSVGPFSPEWMQYVQLNNFTTNFMMEPGYSYHFEPSLLKMREQKPPKAKIKLPLWNKWEAGSLVHFEQALTEKRIQENREAAQYERLLGKIYTRNSSYSSTSGSGRIGWSLQQIEDQRVKLVLLHKKGHPDSLSVYPRESTVLYNLEPAAYTLYLMLESGNYVSADVEVQPNGQTQLYFSSSDIKDASPGSKYLLSLVDEKVNKKRKEEKNKALAEQQFLETVRETTFSYNNGSGEYGHEVSGVVTDKESGEPLPGVTIVLKGTNVGVVTNERGQYRIYVPENGTLVFRFIGYESTEEKINGQETIYSQLEISQNQLQEVVVTAFGVQERRSMTASVATVLQGQTAGVMVRGASSLKVAREDAKPLIIVDGVPYSGDQADLEHVVSTNTLSSEAATALYGAAGAAGVIIITTKAGGALASADTEQLLASANSIRNNFSDYAIWQPRLTTNKQGEASFTTIFPDDITSWNTYVLGMDNKKHSGAFTTNIKSFKAMMATLHLPRFLVEGDKAHVVGKALNYLPDSSEVTTTFEVNGQKVKEARKQLNRSFTDTLHITAPTLAPDSLEVLYSLKQESGFADGERRYVNIFPKGVQETTGHFLPLYSDTTFTLTFDPAKGPVTLHTQGDLLSVMLDEINYLHKYEYWCSEQAASKLKGLLLEKRIREQLGQPFELDRMVKKLIRYLEKAQQEQGGWAWWQQGPTYTWITNHVAEAFVMAEQEGYTVKYKSQKLVDQLVYTLESGWHHEKLTALETLYQLKTDVDFTRYVQELEKKKKLTLEDQFRLTRLRQKLQLPVQLDTLQHHKQQTMLGGAYWGQEKHSLFNNSISNTLLAYQILRADGGHERELAQIRAYLLNERRSGHWRNTYESARILETLLPDMLQTEKGKKGTEVNGISFSGAVNFEAKGVAADTIFEATAPLRVKKQGKLPVYFTAHQTTWNRAPQQVEKDFVITTSLKGIKGDAVLQAGKLVELVVEVEVKADAEFVMIEVPVPASCSYESKEGRGAYEVHREYFRNKVSIFADVLPKGKYTYTIKLLPRYTGTYTLNSAKAELMYFPTFYGRNKMKQVLVQ